MSLSDQFFAGPTLAIETSCDETSAAVVEGTHVRSNVVASQVEMHNKWGGIVPEAAARAHVEVILPVISEALEQAGTTLQDIKAIAATNRPGLVGALSVGVTAAKSLSLRLGIPYIGVHHLEGHLMSPLVDGASVPFPHVCLIVSGGHTELVWVEELGKVRVVGETRDDAAGEAFDKGARLLGLGYPGGYAIQEQAKTGNPNRYPLPKGLSGDTIDFSFSGLKTAVLRLVEKEGTDISVQDAAASLQETIVSVLTERAVRAAQNLGAQALTLVGGVAANTALRERLAGECDKAGIGFHTPPQKLCTDNAGMIGIAGNYHLARGERDDWSVDVYSSADLPGQI